MGGLPGRRGVEPGQAGGCRDMWNRARALRSGRKPRATSHSTQASAFDPDAWYQTNGEFHAAIHGAAHNKMLAEQIEHLNKRLSPYRRFITFRPGRTDTAMREHEAVFEALLARDGLTASMALRDHVRVLAEDSLALSRSMRF